MNGHQRVVLDASAVLASVHGEPGEDIVNAVLSRAAVSAVNWSEVLQKAIAAGLSPEREGYRLQTIGLEVYPFTAEDAEQAALLWPKVRSHGLSLADRASLALASRLRVPVLTTDHVWTKLDVGVEVRAIR